MKSIVLNLQKDSSVALRGDQKFNVLMLGLGWSERKTPGPALDVDPAIIGRDANGEARLEWICYFNQGDIGWCRHSGDNTDGVGELDDSGDDERMWIDLSKVPQEIRSIDLAITMFEGVLRRLTFGDLSWGVVRLVNVNAVNEVRGEEKIRLELTADDLYDVTGFLAFTLVRKGPSWELVTRKGQTGPAWADIMAAANYNNPTLPTP